MDDKSYHMTPQQFRDHGRAMIDWIADYYETIEARPVLSQVKPGDIRKQLPAHAPSQPEDFAAILADIDQVILPGITHWQSPNFFAYFPANASGPAILGDLLSSALGVQGMLWATSPACTELETHVLDWLVPALGLPEKFLSRTAGGGVIQDTASSSSLCAMLAARERATDYRSNRRGCERNAGSLYLQPGPFIDREGGNGRGIGIDNLRLIDVDDRFAMRPDSLAKQISQDQRGWTSTLLCVCYGGNYFLERFGPSARHRRHLPRQQSLVSCGRRHVGDSGAMSGIPLHPGWLGVRRQLYLQPAQVDVHQL